MNILVFKSNRLGDAIVFLPVLQTLRRLHPDWTFTVVTGPGEAPLYIEDAIYTDPVVSAAPPRPAHAVRVLSVDRDALNESWRRPWRLAGWVRRVRNPRPDACLIGFDQGNVAHLLARASGARVRVGIRLPHISIPGSITHPVPAPADRRPAEWNWAMGRALLAALGANAAAWPATPPPPIIYPIGNVINHNHSPAPGGTLVHAGSSGPLSRWDLENFARVANILATTGEVTWIDRLETQTAALAPAVHRATPTSLREFIDLAARAKFFLGNNSGPMHVANALGLSGVVVTGLTAFGWDPYWYRIRWTVLRHPNLPCQPCQPADRVVPVCANMTAPLACLRHWQPDAVAAICRERIHEMDTRAVHSLP